MIKNGISEENLTKLFTHAQIGPKEQDMVRNLSFLGVNSADVRMNILVSTALQLTPINLYCVVSGNCRATARNNIRSHVKSVSPNTPTKCHVGHQLSKTSSKIALTINWISDISHIWPDVPKAVADTMHRPGKRLSHLCLLWLFWQFLHCSVISFV